MRHLPLQQENGIGQERPFEGGGELCGQADSTGAGQPQEMLLGGTGGSRGLQVKECEVVAVLGSCKSGVRGTSRARGAAG